MTTEKNKKKSLIDKLINDYKNKLKIRRKELSMGLEVEKEHDSELGEDTNILHGNMLNRAKIAIAHLKEIPSYYTHLKEMENKYKK